MLTPEQLAAIRSQLTTITQGRWTVSSSPLADSRYMGFVCDCARSMDNSHQYVISDEHYGDAADDAGFIAEAPATIKLLLDEVDRLQSHNKQMQSALAQLSDKEHWSYIEGDEGERQLPGLYMWELDVDPIDLAEHALIHNEQE